MNKKEIKAVIKQPPNIRYEDFITKLVDSDVVWGLYKDGWATGHDEEGNTLIQFFSKKEFAEICAKNECAECKAKPIDLEDFLDKCHLINRMKVLPLVSYCHFWSSRLA